MTTSSATLDFIRASNTYDLAEADQRANPDDDFAFARLLRAEDALDCARLAIASAAAPDDDDLAERARDALAASR